MNENNKKIIAAGRKNYIGYEYKEVTVRQEQAPFYQDCYENFGWTADGYFAPSYSANMTTLRLKRDRKIINHAELTRLQRQFEACMHGIEALEKAKTTVATALALSVGLVGTAFMAGSTFAITHDPPIIWLCILLAIPGFIGWIAPYFLYRQAVLKKTQEIQPLIEAKQDEIYEVCEKAHSLL